MLSDGVCACNGQERTHTRELWRLEGWDGAGQGQREASFLGKDTSLDSISYEIDGTRQGSGRVDMKVQMTRPFGTTVLTL